MRSLKPGLAVSILAIGLSGHAMAQAQALPSYMTADRAMRSSKLIGMTVYNEQNEQIGVVDDIMLPVFGGEVTAVLSVGGFVGGGDKLIKVPLSHIHFVAEKAMMRGGKADLSALPAYSYRGDPARP